MSKMRENPSDQPFNVSGRPNKTKKNSWWQHPPFHNNKEKKNS